MELLNKKEFVEYIKKNYPVYFTHADLNGDEKHIDACCDKCNRMGFLKIRESWYLSHESSFAWIGISFLSFFIQCPTCKRLSFIKTVRIEEDDKITIPSVTQSIRYIDESALYFKIATIPVREESYTVEAIPETEKLLRDTLAEANFCLSHSQYTAAAVMYRRALQIIAKKVLGAKGFTLANQLDWLKDNKNRMNIDLTEAFLENSEIIKDIGNQAAHPDNDEELHYFKKAEVDGMHDLLLSLIHYLYIYPAKQEEMKAILRESRKLKK